MSERSLATRFRPGQPGGPGRPPAPVILRDFKARMRARVDAPQFWAYFWRETNKLPRREKMKVLQWGIELVHGHPVRNGDGEPAEPDRRMLGLLDLAQWLCSLPPDRLMALLQMQQTTLTLPALPARGSDGDGQPA